MARQVKRISDLPEAEPIQGDELLEIVQGGENVRVRADELGGGGPIGDIAIDDVQGLPEALDERVLTTDERLSDARVPRGGAGGVLSGQYPNPGFAVPMATAEALDDKVDKVEGKGLSEEDFTTALRDKLESLNPGSGGIESIVAGSGISVDDSDPVNPIVSATGGGSGGGVESIVAGDGISVDDSDPANPVITAAGGGGGDLPPGGTVGQVLAKAGSEDFDVTWQTPSGGGGGDGITSPTINRIITSTNRDEPLEEGDLLVVLPLPRVIAATYSDQTYGDGDSVIGVAINTPIGINEGDMELLLVSSFSEPITPAGFNLVRKTDSPRTAFSTGMGWTAVYSRIVVDPSPGRIIQVNQTSSGRMAAVLIAVRSTRPIAVIDTAVSGFAIPSSQGEDDHPIPEVIASDLGQMAITISCCALAASSGSPTTVSWPALWVPITPTETSGSAPTNIRLRSWAAYRYMRVGDTTAGVTPHYKGNHDGSSTTVLLGVS